MRRLLFVLLVLVIAAAAAGWFLTAPRTLAAADLPAHEPDLANGEYLFHAGGCAGCHAAPDATGEARLVLTGGEPLVSPFGIFHPPNITPDPQTGIGGWSTLDFVNAMKLGVSPDGRHYYPAFPYYSYQRMALADLIDLKAFLDTLPAARSAAIPHELAFPFTLRRGIGFWKLLYVDGRTLAPDPAASAEVNRGAYLVRGPGHCGECHTPRNLIGGPQEDRALSGAPNPAGRGRVPNITPDPTALGDWSEADIAEALHSGFTPDFDSLGGAMAEVVRNMAELTDADRLAIAAYLKSIPPIPNAPRQGEEEGEEEGEPSGS